MSSCKVYISDEGYGPIVRQKAIIDELRRLDPAMTLTLQTQVHSDEAARIIPDAQVVRKYNLITWHKNRDGSPDLDAIGAAFADYLTRSDEYIRQELDTPPTDLVISDFVAEAFQAAALRGIPSFGVAHFTWDWFFSKLYPHPVSAAVIDRFFQFASLAEVVFFPPFTPPEILRRFGKKAHEVPLIVRRRPAVERMKDERWFDVLLIDSGAGVLGETMQRAIDRLGALDGFRFYVSSRFRPTSENIIPIPPDQLFIDYIGRMDLVIGRAGFNTISECISMRTPMLLLSEAMNPEMNENIINIKKEGLGSFISTRQFTEELATILPRFVRGEYGVLLENMQNHQFETDGARVIAEDMLSRCARRPHWV